MQIVIAGGGPGGASCARVLAKSGIRTVLIEANPGGEKPCAGGIPSMLIDRYKIPDLLIKRKTSRAIFVAPSGLKVETDFPRDMYLGTVKRNEFDSHLRWSAEDAGVRIVQGRVLDYEQKGIKLFIHYKDFDGTLRTTEADFLVGADGAVSRIAQQAMGRALPSVVAIQEEIALPEETMRNIGKFCIFNYSPAVSPDYYGWVFPKDDRVSVGVGTRYENRRMLNALLKRMKRFHENELEGGEVIKRNGALIPSGQYDEHGSGRVVLVGDAAGLVLPACGEGIYFAMRSGEIAGETIASLIRTRPDLIVTRYTNLVNEEFQPIFRYFEKIERLTYQSAESREIFVRLARDKFMARKILKAWVAKEHVPTPIFKKIKVGMDLLVIRKQVRDTIARQPNFGK
ncbi:MAG TPA: geranylgeranyl reductase family protein [Firmicutes bacterium]|nr:geranylgeranyl reductase family protein [Bacillota bacterium]